MKRVMVNLDDETGRLLETKSKEEKRSASSYVGLLVEADLRAAGLLPPVSVAVHSEAIAKLTTGLTEHPELLPEFERMLKNRRRRRRAAA